MISRHFPFVSTSLPLSAHSMVAKTRACLLRASLMRASLLLGGLLSAGCGPAEVVNQEGNQEGNQELINAMPSDEPLADLATFGAGCFWCVEAVFQEIQGVKSVKSGYSGGEKPDPTYEAVCTGTTGHAEVCQIEFDRAQVSYEELLEVFWKTHDPTTLNKQGADEGTQYRSVVFYHTEEQEKLAREFRQKLDDSGAWGAPIVTEISALTSFYPAEANHDNFYRLNPSYGYCRVVIDPKMKKLRDSLPEKLKPRTE